MTWRRTRLALLVPACALAAGVASACQQEIEVPAAQRDARQGAELFSERCSGCHTLEAAASQGSAPSGELRYSERTNGPSFDERKETVPAVLFAIRNGGFSGAIMPSNIVVGEDAVKVARFVCMYAGQPEGKTKPESKCRAPAEPGE